MAKKSEETIPVEEVKVPTFVSIKNFIKSVFIILLSLFCILIGVVIYQMNIVPKSTPDIRSIQAKQIHATKQQKGTIKPQDFKLDSSSLVEIKSNIPQNLPSPKSEVAESPISEHPTLSNQLEDNPSHAEIIYPKKTVSESKIMLKDLLLLKEHLDNGDPCFTDFKSLMGQKNLSNQSELTEALLPICASPKASFDSIEKVFFTEKKKALMTYYHMNNPKWLAYVKAFASSIIDVRRLNPKKQRPKDLLSLAQNALKQKNLAQALSNIQKLPSEMKSDFSVFITDSTQYIQAQNVINTAILTFENKGE